MPAQYTYCKVTQERLRHYQLPPIAEEDYITDPIVSFQQFIDDDEHLEDVVPSNPGSDDDNDMVDIDYSDNNGTESDKDTKNNDSDIEYKGQKQSYLSPLSIVPSRAQRRPKPKPHHKQEVTGDLDSFGDDDPHTCGIFSLLLRCYFEL